MMSARAGQLLLRGPSPSGSGGSLPRRLFAAFHDPFAANYPQSPDQQREGRPQSPLSSSFDGGVRAADGGAPPAPDYPFLGGAPSFEAASSVGCSPVPGSSAFDPSQASSAAYNQFVLSDASAATAGTAAYVGGPSTPGGAPLGEASYGGGLPYAYGVQVAAYPPYQAGSFYANQPGVAACNVGYYPVSAVGGVAPVPPYGVPSAYSPPPQQQGQGPWSPVAQTPGAPMGPPPSWASHEGSERGHGSPRSTPAAGNEGSSGGSGGPSLSARERQRQYLSASLLSELDALEARGSVLGYMQALSGGKLGGRLGPKEWLYATNVLSDLLRAEGHEEADFGLLLQQQLLVLQQLRQLLLHGRSNFLPHDVALLAANAARMHALFSVRFLSKAAAQKAKDVLANPSLPLREALLSAAAAPDAAAAAGGAAEGPLSLSLYKNACDDLLAEVVFCCARKVESFPASTQPSHVRALPTLMRAASAQLLPREQQQQQQQFTAKAVKNVWTEIVFRICPLLGKYEIVQLLHILHGASALANRRVIRDNDLLTLTQAVASLMEQERFAAEVPEAQRARLLLEFFRWSIDTNSPFAFVRHVAWKATRLFKLNVRWMSSNETARLLPYICANRILLSEEELSFFVEVLLKRVSRATPLYAEAQKLNADAAAAALYGVTLNGADPKRFAGLISHLLHESAALEELPRSQSVVFARLCWALCASRAFDPEVAADCWPAAEAAKLLQSALKRVEVDNAASLVLLPEVLTEIELSRSLLPDFEVPLAIQAAAAEASRTQAALDRRQSRRLHHTFRRTLEKLGALVLPASAAGQEGELLAYGDSSEHESTLKEMGTQQQQQSSTKVAAAAEAATTTLSSSSSASSSSSSSSSDRWLFNEVLGPYNVSFYCPSKKVALEIDDRSLGPSKYVKKRHLEALFAHEGLRVVVVGEHLFHLSRVTGEQGGARFPSDLLRSAINSPAAAEEMCPPRHVQLQQLMKSFPRQKAKAEVAKEGATGEVLT
ncbi:hypothetical protein Efla_004530 [Eimeria flavescens]